MKIMYRYYFEDGCVMTVGDEPMNFNQLKMMIDLHQGLRHMKKLYVVIQVTAIEDEYDG